MIDILLYSPQPVLTAGLRVTLAGLRDFHLVGSTATIPLLVDQVRATQARLILVEFTPDVTLEVLKMIQTEARGQAVILWVDAVSTKLASRVIATGVRGILLKTLSNDLLLQCLYKVAAGELWLGGTLTDRLLTANRVILTRRERQLTRALAKGRTNKEMAHALGVTTETVKVYLCRLFRKVGAKTRFEVALFALRAMSDKSKGLVTKRSAPSLRDLKASPHRALKKPPAGR